MSRDDVPTQSNYTFKTVPGTNTIGNWNTGGRIVGTGNINTKITPVAPPPVFRINPSSSRPQIQVPLIARPRIQAKPKTLTSTLNPINPFDPTTLGDFSLDPSLDPLLMGGMLGLGEKLKTGYDFKRPGSLVAKNPVSYNYPKGMLGRGLPQNYKTLPSSSIGAPNSPINYGDGPSWPHVGTPLTPGLESSESASSRRTSNYKQNIQAPANYTPNTLPGSNLSSSLAGAGLDDFRAAPVTRGQTQYQNGQTQYQDTKAQDDFRAPPRATPITHGQTQYQNGQTQYQDTRAQDDFHTPASYHYSLPNEIPPANFTSIPMTPPGSPRAITNPPSSITPIGGMSGGQGVPGYEGGALPEAVPQGNLFPTVAIRNADGTPNLLAPATPGQSNLPLGVNPPAVFTSNNIPIMSKSSVNANPGITWGPSIYPDKKIPYGVDPQGPGDPRTGIDVNPLAQLLRAFTSQ